MPRRPSTWVGPAVNPFAARPRVAAPAVLVAVVLVIALATVALLVGPGGLAHQVGALRASLGSRTSAATTAARPAASGAPQASAPAQPTPTAAPLPTASATPAADSGTPEPAAPAPLPGYSCTVQRGGGSGQSAVTTARVGAQSGFDRFVVEFSGGVPQFEVRPLDSAAFSRTGVLGSAGLTVTLTSTTLGGGPTDLRPGLRVIQEAKVLSASGGTVQWGIGLSHASCFHSWVLGSPSRLVVDVQY